MLFCRTGAGDNNRVDKSEKIRGLFTGDFFSFSSQLSTGHSSTYPPALSLSSLLFALEFFDDIVNFLLEIGICVVFVLYLIVSVENGCVISSPKFFSYLRKG